MQAGCKNFFQQQIRQSDKRNQAITKELQKLRKHITVPPEINPGGDSS
jgi:hypothetical protein